MARALALLLAVLAVLVARRRGRLPRRVPAARWWPLGALGLVLAVPGAVGAGVGRPGAPLCAVWPPGRAAGAPGRRRPVCARPVGCAERGRLEGRGLAGRPQRQAGDIAGARRARPHVRLAVVQEHEVALRQQRQHLLAAQTLLQSLKRQVWGAWREGGRGTDALGGDMAGWAGRSRG